MWQPSAARTPTGTGARVAMTDIAALWGWEREDEDGKEDSIVLRRLLYDGHHVALDHAELTADLLLSQPSNGVRDQRSGLIQIQRVRVH